MNCNKLLFDETCEECLARAAMTKGKLALIIFHAVGPLKLCALGKHSHAQQHSFGCNLLRWWGILLTSIKANNAFSFMNFFSLSVGSL
jgi:hypothetical protein